MTRILVTGVEYQSGLAVVRALRAAGHEPWAAACCDGSYGELSRATQGTVRVADPRVRPAAFAVDLAAHARHLAADVVLPGTEACLLAMAHHLAEFDRDVAVGVPHPSIVAVALDKQAVADHAVAAGFAVPPTLAIGPDVPPPTELAQFLPGVVKPARSEIVLADGGLRRFEAVRVSSPAQVEAAVRALPGESGILQPYLEGRFRTVNGVAWAGRVLTTVHKLAERTWPVDCGVVSYARTVPVDPAVDDATRALIDRLRWSGVFNLQMIEVGGRAHVIDLNPRPYHSLALATRSGVNLPALWVDLLLGRAIRVPAYRAGVRFRSEDDLRALTSLVKHGRLVSAARGAMPRADTVHAVVAMHDLGPSLAIARRAALTLPGLRQPEVYPGGTHA